MIRGVCWKAAMFVAAFLSYVAGVPNGFAEEVIRVKIVVDEEERTTTAVWQQRLKDRLNAASEVINHYANIRFTAAEFGTWQSDDRLIDLHRTLQEMEHEVSPEPCDIVIGFSSQYQFQKGINGLGGTRGPLHTHVLLRETAPNAFEPERLEALIHELGHYLGAAHSRDPMSAMRPVIGDGRARSPAYRIGFDEQNSKIISAVAAEVSALHIRRFSQLSQMTRDRIKKHYEMLAMELPKDPAAPRFLKFLETIDRPAPVRPAPSWPYYVPLR